MSISKQRIKDIVLFALLGLLFWLVIGRETVNAKYAYVDVPRVFDEFLMKKELQKKYNNQMAGRKALVDSLGFQLQKTAIELENNPTPSPKELESFASRRAQYMELVKKFDEEDHQLNSEYDAQIFKQMNQYIRDFGEEKGYTMLFGSMGNGNIMYAEETVDKTDEVIHFLNEKYQGN